MALCLALGNAADAVEIMCVGFIMTEMQKSDNISTSDKEFLSAAVFLGMLFGGVTCGYLSDIFGRKYCLLVSLLLNATAGLASALSPNIDILIFCRVIGGIGIGGSVPTVFSLGAEIFPSNVRGKYLSIIAAFWMVGSIYTALAAWIMLGDNFNGDKILPGVDWRWFAVVSALPAVAALVLTYYILPESPRYLVLRNRFEEAAVVLGYLSGVKVDPQMLSETAISPTPAEVFNPANNLTPTTVNPMPSAIEYNSRTPSMSSTVSTLKKNSPVSTIAILFEGKIRTNTLILLAIWFSLSFGSYGLSSWISLLYEDVGMANAYADSFIYSAATLPGNLLTIGFIDLYGRRNMLSIGMCLAGLSVIGFALDSSQPAVVIISSSLFNCFSVVGWNALDCLSCESFPTKVRTSAMGLLAASGRIGAISAQFVNGSLEKNVPVLLFVTCGCTVMGGLIARCLPEDPSGQSLSFTEENEEDNSLEGGRH
eukprot:CAMPEP_0170068912 /NCGR_PEP_ID=MMETSP0019_2-20121128/7749_1 /TAXON_ID=98059 /ORGANISM="Dinobryon sp., Strain UTEXLB2267" /LENGTH=481 /DNA_ID=CAMNT_0010276755 /DNA_START=106 /DNA_END=1551 /DNA_ORIENTATION=-